jgi:hypothetical protein
MSLSGKASVKLDLTEQKDLDLVSGVAALSKSYDWVVATGTGSGQADLIFSDSYSVAQSNSFDLDLAGLLVPLFAATLTLVKCKAFGIFAGAANPGNLTVGRGATNGFTWISAVSAGVVVPPGGGCWWFAPQAGITVTAGTADLINVTAAATSGTYTYDVFLVGTSA